MNNRQSIVLAGLLGILTSAHGGPLPVSHLIADVPWHRQLNGLLCGDGSLEIVFDYWGPDVSQKAIANVARSSSIGTWCFDVHRAGHFSCLSAAQGSFFPHDVPTAGFTERALGYASFAHAAATPWLAELKALLAADIPVILLMQYAPDGTGGGHYRVAVGYDDLQGLMYFSDPWGRDMDYLEGLPGIIAWTYDEVATAWNYAEYGTPLPFWGTAIMPWNVAVSVKGKLQVGSVITVNATVKYPCPSPFDASEFPASDSSMALVLPEGMTAVSSSSISFGTLGAGASRSASWKVRIESPVAGQTINVLATGVVSGSVPEAAWNGQSNSYPPYDYTDVIGGVGAYTF